MTDNNQQTKTINIELREQEAEGIYANLALISHSASEFFVDFARLTPGVNKARVQARIVMTPQNLKKPSPRSRRKYRPLRGAARPDQDFGSRRAVDQFSGPGR